MTDNQGLMLPRFYVPGLDPAAPAAALPPEEARHLTRVLRLGEGDDIAIFDGRGREFRARVASAVRDRVQVDLIEPVQPAPEPRVPITLAQALIKGDGMDTVVRDATMMGVAAIAPVITARTVGRAAASAGTDARRAGAADARRGGAERGSGGVTARWTRIAVASAKQCRRATLPAIAEPCALPDWLATGGPGLQLILVEPSAAGGREQSMQFLESHAPAALSLLVGPEGGWTPDERALAEAAGCLPVTLGPLTVRADAVAVVAIAMARLALREG